MKKIIFMILTCSFFYAQNSIAFPVKPSESVNVWGKKVLTLYNASTSCAMQCDYKNPAGEWLVTPIVSVGESWKFPPGRTPETWKCYSTANHRSEWSVLARY